MRLLASANGEISPVFEIHMTDGTLFPTFIPEPATAGLLIPALALLKRRR